MNQAFYDNLPVQQVAPQRYAPTPQAGPSTSPWVEPLGGGMQAAPPAPPAATAPYSPGPVDPQPLIPPLDESPQTLPPISPDETGTGASWQPDRLPGVVDLENQPVQFPDGVIPMAEPAAWSPGQEAPEAEGPAPIVPGAITPHQAEVRAENPADVAGNAEPGLETYAFPSMLELLQGMPGMVRQNASPAAAAVSAASYEEKTSAKPEQPVVGDQLQAPATPPAMLQQPLGAPLFQSPGR